jgi:hypothetical protein
VEASPGVEEKFRFSPRSENHAKFGADNAVRGFARVGGDIRIDVNEVGIAA